MSPREVVFDRGFKTWGVCLTAMLAQMVTIGVSHSFGAILKVGKSAKSSRKETCKPQYPNYSFPRQKKVFSIIRQNIQLILLKPFQIKIYSVVKTTTC